MHRLTFTTNGLVALPPTPDIPVETAETDPADAPATDAAQDGRRKHGTTAEAPDSAVDGVTSVDARQHTDLDDTESSTASTGVDGAGGPVVPDDDRSADSGDGETALPLDVLFALLENSRRRETLRYLDDNDGSATLDELAETIAAKENGIDIAQLGSQQRKRVYIALYQCHLPRLADAGVIDYNRARGTIEVTSAADRLYRYLDLDPVAHRDDPSGFTALRRLLTGR